MLTAPRTPPLGTGLERASGGSVVARGWGEAEAQGSRWSRAHSERLPPRGAWVCEPQLTGRVSQRLIQSYSPECRPCKLERERRALGESG